MWTRLVAEFLGTALLVAAVVGSGIMGAALSTDNLVILLANMVATVAALGVLIWLLGLNIGAHFNPAVTMIAVIRRELNPTGGLACISAQVLGGLSGVALANVMFDLPAWHAASTVRAGTGIWLGEVVATAGLLLVVGALGRTNRTAMAPVVIAAWIGSAYFFTASTSFANPAVTVGRAFTDTFTGIAPGSVLPFIVAQLIGAGLGALLTDALFRHTSPSTAAQARESAS
ncbi:MAG: aquaporin [Actinomycetales bacterium]|nr:aquaporin [Actinomycetales bacterium]